MDEVANPNTLISKREIRETNKRIAKLEKQLADYRKSTEFDLGQMGQYQDRLEQSEKREAKLRVAFTEYRIHIGRCAPLTWASVNKPEYMELAHKWEEEWKVLDDKARATLEGGEEKVNRRQQPVNQRN